MLGLAAPRTSVWDCMATAHYHPSRKARMDRVAAVAVRVILDIILLHIRLPALSRRPAPQVRPRMLKHPTALA